MKALSRNLGKMAVMFGMSGLSHAANILPNNINPDPNPLGSDCAVVDSQAGWVRIRQRPANGNNRMELTTNLGGWTVDKTKYGLILPINGHTNPELEQFAQYKYDGRFPFGKLLMWDDGDAAVYGPIHGVYMLRQGLMFRINDSDATLGDNQGAMKVCLRYFHSNT